jgi:hypothetical protein
MPDRCSSVVVKVRGDVCATSLEPRSTPVWRLAVLVSLSAICFTAHATVYKCKKADGSTVYSDIPCGPGAQTQVIQAPPSEGNAGAPQSNGTNQAVDRNQASACWLSVNLQTMQGFQRDCHWTARTRAFTTSSQAPVEGPSR